MADNPTADTGLLPRTYFRAPRVPLDLRALFLALVGLAIFRAGAYLLEKITGTDVVISFFQEAMSLLEDIPYVGRELQRLVYVVFCGADRVPVTDVGGFWYDLIGGVWVLAVWGFFAQAIHRITSLRIARDEGLSLVEGVKFSIKNFVTILCCPLIVAVAIGIFYGCNALAGVVLAVPFLSWILAWILLPLAAISTLLILLIGIGGVVGLPLVGAAAAWERNGPLDAISRAFSYIFARPLQFFWNYFLILLFTAIIVLVGQHFVNVLTKSVDAGVWSPKASILVDTPDRGSEAYGKLDNETKNLYDELNTKDAAGAARPFSMSIHAVGKAPLGHKGFALVLWILLNVIQYGVYATAIWWFFGAATSTYADLRADVDGTEEDEIYLEDEEEDFEALAKTAPAPGAPAPAAPATGTPPATTPPATPPPTA